MGHESLLPCRIEEQKHQANVARINEDTMKLRNALSVGESDA